MKKFLFLIFSSFLISIHGQNNLKHQVNYNPIELNSIPQYKKYGDKKVTLLLISGWGMPSSIWNGFIEKNKNTYTIYNIALPGFDGTVAPEIPEEGTDYSKKIWTKSAMNGIVKLIKQDNLENVFVIAHFITATQVGFELSINYPELIGGFISVGGPIKFIHSNPQYASMTPEMRAISVTKGMAQQWFKTISEDVWDENNFKEEFYSSDQKSAKKLWDDVAKVDLPIMIQYICEYYASDPKEYYSKLTIPTLALIPSFNEEIMSKVDDPNYNFIKPQFYDSWYNAQKINSKINVEIIPDSHFAIMLDNPKLFEQKIKSFIKSFN
ncbi:alpha/beta hydrolase [uncultured Psychroserpens sp.]|uniref:alpha/beta fold hydrolase n=1 Tax=uncultured Psychroserpens sp. TaxID=255436 RepID=UPI00262F60F9|nr:alpha/beta hydrolase [uncultured Psychroserpens sp.]